MWALLVGIEQYAAHDDWDVVWGALRDVHDVQEYLLTELHVPAKQIRTLVNGQATRAQILSAFQQFLIQNTEIEYGDAILFHFSGHGSVCRAPDGWPIVDRGGSEDGYGKGMLEVIIPYDESMPIGEGAGRVCSIPDRTLATLLARLAQAHGENITIVLDCCHSGHGTRLPELDQLSFVVRGADPDSLTPLHVDLDQDLVAGHAVAEVSERAYIRSAFTERRAKSHILMAACGQRELALCSERGGLFTILWLRALRCSDIYPKSYYEVLKHILKELKPYRIKYPELVTQNPQCEGISRHRIVFQNATADRRQFLVHHTEDTPRGHCRIEAGTIHGVHINTTFELDDSNVRTSETPAVLCSAVARIVSSHFCYAELAQVASLDIRHILARVSQWAHPLDYYIKTSGPVLEETLQVLNTLTAQLRDPPSNPNPFLRQLSDQDHADLILQVDSTGVTLRRLDVFMGDLESRSPRVEAREVKDFFPGALHAAARFNFYLSQDNPLHPLAEHVQLEFYLLDDEPIYDLDDDLDFMEVRGLKRQVLFKNDEAEIPCNSSEGYAFVLHNISSKPLFAYLMYFDPSTYAIENWFSPFEVDNPPLLPRQSLQIGASPEHSSDFRFALSPGDDKDTCFVKVYLLDVPTDMTFMEQGPFLGCDKDGHRFARRANDMEIKAKPQNGIWDTINCKVSVVRAMTGQRDK